MTQFLARLAAALERWPEARVAPRFAVAFSGGVDSTVLLAAMCRIVTPARVAAWHVDHGLHADSTRWVRHCERAAAALGVEFAARRVEIDSVAEHGVEAAARAARYAALADLMRPGDFVLTAHHGDDQLETILLRLLRGTGVRGLTGINEVTPFGRGFLARPLLELTRAEIVAQARRWELHWIEDPANEAQRFDRSFLRARVAPALQERWPAAPRAANGLARRMREAQALLDERAREDAGEHAQLGRLPLERLRAIGTARLGNLLRFAVEALGLPVPHAAHVERLCAAVRTPPKSAGACVAWPGAQARIYRDHLYLLAPLPARPADGRGASALTAACEWRGPEGRLALVPSASGPFADDWAREGFEVRFRSGGERIRPAGHAHSKTLKHWFQENGIVPWMRDRVPLIFRDGALVAIADLCVSEQTTRAQAAGPRWRIEWTDHAPIR